MPEMTATKATFPRVRLTGGPDKLPSRLQSSCSAPGLESSAQLANGRAKASSFCGEASVDGGLDDADGSSNEAAVTRGCRRRRPNAIGYFLGIN